VHEVLKAAITFPLCWICSWHTCTSHQWPLSYLLPFFLYCCTPCVCMSLPYSLLVIAFSLCSPLVAHTCVSAETICGHRILCIFLLLHEREGSTGECSFQGWLYWPDHREGQSNNCEPNTYSPSAVIPHVYYMTHCHPVLASWPMNLAVVQGRNGSIKPMSNHGGKASYSLVG